MDFGFTEEQQHWYDKALGFARRDSKTTYAVETNVASFGGKAGGCAPSLASKGCLCQPNMEGRGATSRQRSPRWRGSDTAAPTAV